MTAPRRISRPAAAENLHDAPPPSTLPPLEAALDDDLPGRTALMVVTTARGGDGVERFKVRLHSPDLGIKASEHEDVRLQVRPPFTLAQIMRDQNWEDDYSRVAAWWHYMSQLNEWMLRLVQASADDEEPFRLIVWDQTPYQIAWELFFVPRRGWLGAHVDIVRWTTLENLDQLIRYRQPSRCEGGVLAMEDQEVVRDHGAVLDHVLQPYGTAPLPSLRRLLVSLSDSNCTPALVVVRTHGLYEDGGEYRLGGLSWRQCNLFELDGLKHAASVVVLNACDTAVPEEIHSLRSAAKFVELFLDGGASTVIATVGPVGLDHSYQFAVNLLLARRVRQKVSTILLEHRREGVRRVWPEQEPDLRTKYDFEAFFQAFTYVHFGHPDTTLCLVPG